MPLDRELWLQHYPEGVRPSLEYPRKTLDTYLDEAVQQGGDTPATIFFGRSLTYRQLADHVDRLATALTALGVAKGDRVAVMLPNCPQAIIAYYAVLKLGGVVVQTNPLYVERELEFQLQDSGAETIIALDLVYPRIAAVRGSTPLERVILTRISDYFPLLLRLLYPLKQRREGSLPSIPAGDGILWFDQLVREHRPAPPRVEVDVEADPALLQYTGGTTGRPKAAVLTHFNLVANTLQTREWIPGTGIGSERILAVLPFFHVYGMTACMNLAVVIRATLILLPRFVVADVLKAIDKHRPTLFPGAPTMYVAINNHPEVKNYNISSIKACLSGAAALPVEVQQRFEELTGGRLVEGYGLTEASPVTHCNPIFGKRKSGRIGIPFPDTDCKIADMETGLELPLGEVGELCVRGPQVMQGYWNRPEETAQALRDGWLYTGDIAQVDEDGFFAIVDRKKDLIIAGGYNIYPREVEEVLFEHPKVKEAAVVGVPDEYRGETVKGYVVLKEGQTATAEEIIAFCRERMARYKAPTSIEFRADLPKTLVGKVLRRKLLEEELQAQDHTQGPAAG